MLGTNFFTGSENLYKYLVSIGMMLIVLTVYYPLKEKQKLEILKIELEGEVKILNYQIKENLKNVNILQANININGAKAKELESLAEIEEINNENNIRHIECEQKHAEIEARKKQITLYNTLFWIFLPIGIIITALGFICWYKVKRVDDSTAKLNAEKLQLEVDRLRKDLDS